MRFTAAPWSLVKVNKSARSQPDRANQSSCGHWRGCGGGDGDQADGSFGRPTPCHPRDAPQVWATPSAGAGRRRSRPRFSSAWHARPLPRRRACALPAYHAATARARRSGGAVGGAPLEKRGRAATSPPCGHGRPRGARGAVPTPRQRRRHQPPPHPRPGRRGGGPPRATARACTSRGARVHCKPPIPCASPEGRPVPSLPSLTLTHRSPPGSRLWRQGGVRDGGTPPPPGVRSQPVGGRACPSHPPPPSFPSSASPLILVGVPQGV